ncbi:TonB-dependent receptor [Rubrivivax gelatinosus]|uniref:TonB-dependent receptor n=1 Tax=Rubrivivax gelatinosus TaxID=28068 RepID=A0ABS1DQS9_RUBGE|nr:TonB-dependent receptor [Rubrivivax gelatinosus]MBK1711959.1 TonB-dependent receptor [Rubrivivax gelatinosus]
MPGYPRAPAHHAIAAAAIAALHLGASAQDSSEAAEAGKLQTINITAERRLENIQEVPNSVSVLQGETLEVLNTSGQDIRMLSARVPSLNIESSFGRAFPRFYIRGYGNTDFRLNASQPVSLVYDDVVQENPILKGFPAFDLERVEVLRGPQGTLFGRNTPAGVVKFDSVAPTQRFEGYGSLSYGTWNTVNLEGALNVPTSETSALRVSVLNQTRSDWVENTFEDGPTQDLEGYRDSAVRLQWKTQPTKDFSALFNLHARDFDGSARLFRANIIKLGSNDLVGGFDPDKISINGVNHSELQNYGGSARLRWDLGSVTLHSVTGYETVKTYSRGDIDGGTTTGPGVIFFQSETADGIPTHDQWTQEFRVESNGKAAIGWQAGVFLFHENFEFESFGYDSTTAGNPQNAYERSRQKNDAWAVFGATTWQATPALSLRAGLRYTRDKKDFDVLEYSGGLETLDDTSATTHDNKASWDLSATYTLAKDINLYARAATGFRASSVQGAGAFNGQSIAKPETNTSFEAGVKADLFERRARVGFNVFRYTVKDQQLTAVGGAANSNILLNADKATGQGFELDLQAYLTENLLATLGVGYNDTEIKDKNLAVATCAQCTVTDPLNADGKALIDGNALPQAPKRTVSFTLKYTQPLGAGDVYVFTDWAYRSEVNFFLYESKEFTGKALLEGGLRVGYTWGNGKYDAAAFVRNLTDQVRVVGGIDFNNRTGFINDPRTFGLQFKASF